MSNQDPQSANPSPSPSTGDALAALAHQTYFERGDWRAALMMWSAYEAANGPTLASRFAITHCSIELADPSALSSLTLGDPPDETGTSLEVYVHVVRSRAFQHLTAGDAARAAQLTRLLAVVDPQLSRLYRTAFAAPEIGPPLTPPDDRGREPLPFERERKLDDAAIGALLDGLRRRRVLLVTRRVLDFGKGVVEAELFRQYHTSIRAAGLEPAILDAHTIAPERRHLFPDQLRALMTDFQPDIVFYDDFLATGMSADPTLQPAILDILHTARRERGVRLAATYPDAWYDGMDAFVEAAVDLVDVFHIFHPGLLPRLSDAARAKVFCYPHPSTDPRRAPRPPSEVLERGCFIGGINWANMSRLAWWTEIARSGLPIDLYPTMNYLERTPEQYAHLVSRYAITVSFTTRSNGKAVLTSRTVEAALYGAVVLDEYTDDTAYFMRPFEHYVPFANFVELATRLQQLILDRPLRQEIARRGSAWVRHYFSGGQFWARLYQRLYETDPSRLPPRSSGFAPVRLEVPTTSSALVDAVKALKR